MSYTGMRADGTTAPDSGTLTAIANASDTLSGSLSIKVGTGTAHTIMVGAAPSTPAPNTFYTGSASGWNTLSGLEVSINTASLGVTASIGDQRQRGRQSLSLVSNSHGSAGALTVNSSINDITGTTALAYTNPVSGADANLTVDGVALTSASNTVANLIPGVTFQFWRPARPTSRCRW